MQRKMNPSMKVGMLALVGICLIFYQYHLSMRVRLDQVTGFTSPLDDSSNLQTGEEFEARITEEMVRESNFFQFQYCVTTRELLVANIRAIPHPPFFFVQLSI